MKKHAVIILLILIQVSAYSITIMKNVGHGDCYVVISDGRIIVVDAGSKSSNNGLISLLRSGYFNYDRIVITHVHADHFGGLITAGQYLKTTDSKLTTNMLVSNHGTHDLDLVINESNLGELIKTLREKPIVLLSDDALSKLSFSDENIAIEGLILDAKKAKSSENLSCLAVKVTEIRDGQRKATLFLGDIEKSQQKKLFKQPNSKDFFKDVVAVTIPHHGRPGTLHRKFFDNVKEFIGPNTILLHSDDRPINLKLKETIAKLDLKIKSTTDINPNEDVIINPFSTEKTYCLIKDNKTTIESIVQNEYGNLLKEMDYTMEELVSAVSKYSNFSGKEQNFIDKPISLPTNKYIATNIKQQRLEFEKQTENFLSLLKSPKENISKDAEIALRERFAKLSPDQLNQFNNTLEELAKQRQKLFDDQVVRNISLLKSINSKEADAAENFLQTNYSKLNQKQIDQYRVAQKEAFNEEIDRKIVRLKNLDPDESVRAENELKLLQSKLNQQQKNEVDKVFKEIKIRRQVENYFSKRSQNLKIICNDNLDNYKYFVYDGYKSEWDQGTLKYVVKNNGTYDGWDVFYAGSQRGSDLAKYGKKITTIKEPSNAAVNRRTGCDYCGGESIGYCHMRNKYVCESHHNFYQGGTHWRCP